MSISLVADEPRDTSAIADETIGFFIDPATGQGPSLLRTERVDGIACPAAVTMREAVDQHLPANAQIDHGVDATSELVEHAVESLGLRHGTREAIENEAALGIRLLDPVLDDFDHQRVGDELAPVHEVLDLIAERRACPPLRTQDVPGGNLRDLVGLDQGGALRAFPGARGAKDDQVHKAMPAT